MAEHKHYPPHTTVLFDLPRDILDRLGMCQTCLTIRKSVVPDEDLTCGEGVLAPHLLAISLLLFSAE